MNKHVPVEAFAIIAVVLATYILGFVAIWERVG